MTDETAPLSDDAIKTIVADFYHGATLWYRRKYWQHEHIKKRLSEMNMDQNTYDRCVEESARKCGI